MHDRKNAVQIITIRLPHIFLPIPMGRLRPLEVKKNRFGQYQTQHLHTHETFNNNDGQDTKKKKLADCN